MKLLQALARGHLQGRIELHLDGLAHVPGVVLLKLQRPIETQAADGQGVGLLDGVRLVQHRLQGPAHRFTILDGDAALPVDVEGQHPVPVLLLELHVPEDEAQLLHRLPAQGFAQLSGLHVVPPLS